MLKNIIFMWLISTLSFSSMASEPINVGMVFSTTGVAAAHNAPLIEMVKLAADEINNEGGLLGHHVKLILLDNKSTPIGSREAGEKAVALNTTAVIGAHWSSHSLSLAPILQEAGIPMISPGSTNPKVTKIGDYIFRVCFLDSFQGEAMAKFAYTDLGAESAVVLRNIDEAYSTMLAEFFVNAFKRFGGQVFYDGNYRGKAVDFSDVLKKTAELDPDVVYIPGYTRDSGLIIKQAKSFGVKATFLGGDAWDEIYKVAGEAANGNYHSAPWHPDVPLQKSKHLKKIYRQKYNRDIENMSAPLAYDAFMILANAIKRAGTLNGLELRDTIAKTKEFNGATGIFSFDKNGDPQGKEIIILKLEKGRPIYYKAISP